jgi:predicted ATPase
VTPTLGRQLLHFAETTGDPVFLVGAHAAMSATAYWSGDFQAVSQHWEQCLAHYDAGQQDAHALVFGQNPAPFAQLYGGLTDWFLGYPDRAVLRVRKAMAMAEETRHPFTIVAVQHLGGDLCYRRREFAQDAEFAERAMALSLEHHFPLWLGGATSSRGWGLVARGEVEAGIAMLREGIEMVAATGSNINGSYMRSKLTEAYLQAGRVAEGIATVDDALRLASRSLDRYWEAELWRQKGELRLLGGDSSDAETCFQQALEIARRQGTPMLELRAATSLARLWRSHGRADDGHRLLENVYGTFSEGFETPDLKDAAALLSELRG